MNRITELLGVKYPIIQGGMIWNSGWKLASAVSNNGGLGLIGAGSMHPETFREHIQKSKVEDIYLHITLEKSFLKQINFIFNGLLIKDD